MTSTTLLYASISVSLYPCAIYPYSVLFSQPRARYGCYGLPPCPLPYPISWPGYKSTFSLSRYPSTSMLSLHTIPPTQTQLRVQSPSTVPDISKERLEKIMAKIKLLQEKIEKNEAKKVTKWQVTPSVAHTPSSEKILSLKPRPILFLQPRPVLIV